MDPLVRASLLVRRSARAGAPLLLSAAIAALVLARPWPSKLTPFDVVVALGWVAIAAQRTYAKFIRGTKSDVRVDVEVGMLGSIGLFGALLFADGEIDGQYAPAVYVFVGLVAAVSRPVATWLVVTFVAAFGACVDIVALGRQDWTPSIVRAGFLVAFALLSAAFVGAEIIRARKAAKAALRVEREKIREEARSFRLLRTGDADVRDDERDDRVARSSVEEIHQSVHYALDLLRRTLGLNTAVLLWLNDAGTHFRISELSTVSDDVRDAPLTTRDGVLGAVVQRREVVALENLKPSNKVPYYEGPCPVRVLAGIPVMDGENLRGVLFVDRTGDRGFSPHEIELAAQAARFCLRAIENERVFVQLERAKVEQGKLYRAAQELGRAVGEKAVVDAAVRSAREVASFELAAVTVFDPTSNEHRICAVASDDSELAKLVGCRFQHNTGLVSMVVENRFSLPYRGEYDPHHQVVFKRGLPWPKMPSLLVLPLLVRDQPLGTLVLGSNRRGAFGDTVRPTLEVLASHLAISLSNARVMRTLETMATTDGMTGLFNKRAMLDQAKNKLAAAKRFSQPLSVLVTDIDFFKSVNDTYGHDVGDHVIRGLGDVLRRCKRETDVVARFGGEEFVVLCEQTDTEGAVHLAERVRQELEAEVFQSEHGPLSVTCSVGVATLDGSMKDWDALFKAADEALYASKNNGRNRVTAWAPRRNSGIDVGRGSRRAG